MLQGGTGHDGDGALLGEPLEDVVEDHRAASLECRYLLVWQHFTRPIAPPSKPWPTSPTAPNGSGYRTLSLRLPPGLRTQTGQTTSWSGVLPYPSPIWRRVASQFQRLTLESRSDKGSRRRRPDGAGRSTRSFGEEPIESSPRCSGDDPEGLSSRWYGAGPSSQSSHSRRALGPGGAIRPEGHERLQDSRPIPNARERGVARNRGPQVTPATRRRLALARSRFLPDRAAGPPASPACPEPVETRWRCRAARAGAAPIPTQVPLAVVGPRTRSLHRRRKCLVGGIEAKLPRPGGLVEGSSLALDGLVATHLHDDVRGSVPLPTRSDKQNPVDGAPDVAVDVLGQGYERGGDDRAGHVPSRRRFRRSPRRSVGIRRSAP